MDTSWMVRGSGPLRVVWLHGWMGHAAMWDPMVAALDERLFTHAFFEARGHGRRRLVPGRFDLDEIADDLLTAADRQGWTQFSVVGHHMGAKAMVRLLAKAPQRLQRLAALTPAPMRPVPLESGEWRFHARAARDNDACREVLDQATGRRLGGVWLQRQVSELRQQVHPDAMNAYLQAWSQADLSATLQGVRQALWIGLGEHDRPPPAESGAAWRLLLPQADVVVLANAGQFPMQELPIRVAAQLEHFLAG